MAGHKICTFYLIFFVFQKNLIKLKIDAFLNYTIKLTYRLNKYLTKS
jgi:hypothetical protein